MSQEASMAAAAGLLLGTAIRARLLIERGDSTAAHEVLGRSAEVALRLTVIDADDAFIEAMVGGRRGFGMNPSAPGRPEADPHE